HDAVARAAVDRGLDKGTDAAVEVDAGVADVEARVGDHDLGEDDVVGTARRHPAPTQLVSGHAPDADRLAVVEVERRLADAPGDDVVDGEMPHPFEVAAACIRE